MACIHIYYGDRHAVLHGRLVTIQNCHVLESNIDPYCDLDQLKSHIVDLLGVNLTSYQVHLEGVQPRVVPNAPMVVYTLFELGRNNAWALYVRKAGEEGFELGRNNAWTPAFTDSLRPRDYSRSHFSWMELPSKMVSIPRYRGLSHHYYLPLWTAGDQRRTLFICHLVR